MTQRELPRPLSHNSNSYSQAPTNITSSGAVADGTVLWHCASDIIERTPPRAFGTEIDVPFDQSHPEHCDRAQTVKSSGTYISGRWLQLAPGVRIILLASYLERTNSFLFEHPRVCLSTVMAPVVRATPGNTRDLTPTWVS